MIDAEKLKPLLDFLPCSTPDAWIEKALENIPMLLINHCYLEQCAARNAVTLISRYPEKVDLLDKMSKLAREELVHFERVLKLLKKRGLVYRPHKPSRYAGRLQQAVRKTEPDKFADTMVMGAFIEARSCERFYRLAPHLDAELSRFYQSLLQSEARHFEDYLNLGRHYAEANLDDRIAFFADIERQAILSEDDQFRFHSGMPVAEAH